MATSGRFNPCAMIFAAACAGAALSFSSLAHATTPSLLWAGARHIAVHCLVQSRTASNLARMEVALCQRVRALAARQSKMSVEVAGPGHPALIRSDAVVLLVHLSIERSAKGQTVAFAIRPYRPTGGNADVYFGAAPRALFTQSGLLGPTLDRELEVALREIMPSQTPTELEARPLRP
jgi:hypothetical protein